MADAALQVLKNSLATVVRVETEKRRCSTREIVSRFRSEHPDLIGRNSETLQDIGLVRLVNDVAKSHPTEALDPNQPELFSEFAVPSTAVLPNQEGGGMVRSAFQNLNRRELEQWIRVRSQPRIPNSKAVEAAQDLLAFISPFMSGDMTVSEAWMSAIEAHEEDGRQRHQS